MSMEQKQITFENDTILTLTDKNQKLKVKQGTVYSFAVKKLEDGRTGARTEAGTYTEGQTIPSLTGDENWSIILCGKNAVAEILEASEEEINDFEEQNRQLLEKLSLNEEKQAAAFTEQQKRSEEVFDKSLRSIVSVVNSKTGAEDCYEADDQSIVKAFKIVSSKMNLTAQTIHGKDYPSSRTGIQQLAKDNTIRVREIVLQNNWHNNDNGHLIAFLSKEEIPELSKDYDLENNCVPVALIRTNYSGYIMINPQDNSQTPVSEENINRIYPKAFMLYKALPDTKLKFKDILAFVFTDIKWDIVRFASLALMCTLIGLITPEITRNFVDYVIPNAAKNQAMLITIMIIVIGLSSLAAGIAKELASLRMGTRSANSLDSAVIDRMLKLPVNFFKDYNAGELSDRIAGVSTMQQQIFSMFMSVAMNFIFCFIYIIQMFRYCDYFAWKAALFCLIPVTFSVVSCLITYKAEKELLQSGGKISGMLLQFLNGIEKITNSNSRKRVFAQFEKENIRQNKIAYQMTTIQNYFGLINVIFPTLVSIFLYYFYGKAVREQNIQGLSTGTFMAFLSSFGSFQNAILGITGALLGIRNLFPMGKRVAPILQAEPEIEESKPSITSLKGKIEINHLNFRYDSDGPLILNNINMTVNPGEFVAVVGSSGAGKSTLLRMLLGFEKPESGSIFYDEQDMNSYDIGSIRRQMGVVLQNDTVLAGSILQNIVGSSGKKEEDAWEAARKVAFDKDIAAMPMGMFTMIPAGGLSLSGGQLQRLIIARAIIRNPNLLIFDEATSALDNITQSIVRQSLDELKVTRVVIAHRLSTIINADRIYVMKNGEIIETGTYDELMNQQGWFYQMAQRQKI